MKPLPITTSRGTDLLREVFQEIDRDRRRKHEKRRWNQGAWGLMRMQAGKIKKIGRRSPTGNFNVDVEPEVMMSCGSAMCFAGHAAIMAGDTPVIRSYAGEGKTPKERVDEMERYGSAFLIDDVRAEGKLVRISVRAQKLLGLTNHEADRLFSGTNSFEDVKRIVNEILHSRGEEGL